MFFDLLCCWQSIGPVASVGNGVRESALVWSEPGAELVEALTSGLASVFEVVSSEFRGFLDICRRRIAAWTSPCSFAIKVGVCAASLLMGVNAVVILKVVGLVTVHNLGFIVLALPSKECAKIVLSVDKVDGTEDEVGSIL